MALFGQVQEFDQDKEEWSQYVERLDQYFLANDIQDAAKKRAILLTVMGPIQFKLLKNIIAPAKPEEKTYKEIVDELKDHHNPQPSEIVQRFKFNTRVRQPGESVATFVSELRAISETCNFGNTLEVMLRDRLVCGINDLQVQRKLLAHKALTFKQALHG